MRLLLSLTFLGTTASAAPLSFTWQARLVDPTGVPYQGEHDVTVRLYDASGTPRWTRAYQDEAFSDGYVTVVLGTDDVGVTLEAATRGATPVVEIGIQIDTQDELSPREAFRATPRAAIADAVAAGAGLTGTACTGAGALAFDVTANNLVVCGNAGVWQDVGGCPDGAVAVDGVCVPCGAAAVSAEGPLYFWNLDDAGSVAVDVTGRDSGTYNGSITRSSTTPVFGSQGLTFPGGTANWIQVPTFNPPVGDSTVMAWVKTTTLDAGIVSYAVASEFNEWLPVYRMSEVSYLVKGAAGTSTTAVNDDAWHHLAFSRVEATGVVSIYVDGVLVESVTVSPGQSPAGGGNLVFGQEQDSLNGGFQSSQSHAGGLDDIAMFASALDAATISRVYHGQRCE